MPTILAYSASVPSNGVDPGGILPGGAVLPVALTAANSPLVLADLGLYLPSGAPNRVELKAIIGYISAGAGATIEIEIYRDQIPFFSEVIGITPAEGQYAPAVLAIDFNAPVGFHVYRIETSIVTLQVGASVTVTGPIEFSGLAIGLP
jgi:hypothetical protein